jgi:subtilase family serine protease
MLAALLCLTGAAQAAGSSRVKVGSKPVLPAGARSLGALAQSTPIQATVTLQPRDPQALSAYAQAVSDPSSSAYHRYLTVAEFAQRFGPTTAQIRAVRSSLRTEGLQPGAVSANRLSVPVTASAAQLGSAFSTSFARYRLADGRSAYANTSAPSVQAAVAGTVQGVLGLSTLAVPHPLNTPHSAGIAGAGAAPRTTTTSGTPPSPCTQATTQAGIDGSYTADQIASAYGLTGLYTQSDFGSGVTVALYELEPYSSSDISAYQSCYGTSASVTNVSVDGGAGSGAGQGEAALDIEDVAGLAPQASIRVYEGPNTNSGAYDTYSRIVTDNVAQVISTSWGLCESQEGATAAQSENTLFQEAATQGQSIFAASGDNGTTDCTNFSGKPIKARAVDDPASQPYVTGVGGTSMTSVGPPPTETVWNDGGSSGASGGGVSTLWTQPSYQAGFAVPQSSITCTSALSTNCREVPDVSASADEYHGYVIYYSGGWTSFGGTSVAAPTWASLTALADASSACAGTEVGFANAALYRAASTGYSTDFNDITSGNNSYDTVTGYSAGTGYDMASGLGSPKGTALASALCTDATDSVTVQNPGNQSSTTDTAITPVTASASSSTGATVTYSASNLPSGLTINTSSGTISGTPIAAGTYTVTVRAVDTHWRVGTASFTWVVSSPSGSGSGSGSSTGTTTSTSGGGGASASKVTISPIGSPTGRVGTAQSLLITASDSRGLPLRYSASGLPAGLSIGSSSGLVAGTPKRAGRSTVNVTVTDSAGSSASASFLWTIEGRPSVVSRSLTLLNTGRPQLSLKLQAGSLAPALRSVSVQSRSRGLRLSTKRPSLIKGIVARAGSRLKIVSRAHAGVISVRVSRAAGTRALTLRIGTPELSLSPSLGASLGTPHPGRPKLTLVITDAQGVSTRISVVV